MINKIKDYIIDKLELAEEKDSFIIENHKQHDSLLFKTAVKTLIVKYIPLKVKKSRIAIKDKNGNFAEYEIETVADIDEHLPEIAEIIEYCRLVGGNSVMGCCHKYVECSDAGVCINKKYQYICQYNQNLKNGLIFYGKNRKD